jgi:hypothetical protein
MRRALLLTALLLAGASAGVAGCSQMATADAVAETAKAALDTVPSAIRAVADMALVTNKADWGKPTAVRATKNHYVFFYATPESELRRTGHPRMVVVNRRSRIARLTDMEHGA